ncbi:MAG: HU family DNA-binding protein [Hyphomicrobiales bacterium]|nr:HU family DNA-binding protein [Hyphomicrobiales bacterium]
MENDLNEDVSRIALRKAVYRKTRTISRRDSAKLVEDFLSEISDCLVAGEAVKLRGFGNFIPRRKASRPGRNPKTKEDATISARTVILFHPARTMVAHMNAALRKAKPKRARTIKARDDSSAAANDRVDI